jgi:hypothetical protein
MKLSDIPIWSLAYATTAVTTALLIKYLILEYPDIMVGNKLLFPRIMLVQNICSLVLLSRFIFQDKKSIGVTLKNIINNELSYAFIPALFGCLNTFIGFICQQLVNVPIMLVFRRTSSFTSLMGEKLIMKNKKIDMYIFASIIIICFGAVIAGWEDIYSELIAEKNNTNTDSSSKSKTLIVIGYSVILLQNFNNCEFSAIALTLLLSPKNNIQLLEILRILRNFSGCATFP